MKKLILILLLASPVLAETEWPNQFSKFERLETIIEKTELEEYKQEREEKLNNPSYWLEQQILREAYLPERADKAVTYEEYMMYKDIYPELYKY